MPLGLTENAGMRDLSGSELVEQPDDGAEPFKNGKAGFVMWRVI